MQSILKITFLLVASIIFVNVTSCTDVTNISKEELKEYKIRIDGLGSITPGRDLQRTFIVNGRIVSEELIERIKLNYIDSLSILRDNATINLYGKAVENFVIKIQADEKIFADLKPIDDARQNNE